MTFDTIYLIFTKSIGSFCTRESIIVTLDFFRFRQMCWYSTTHHTYHQSVYLKNCIYNYYKFNVKHIQQRHFIKKHVHIYSQICIILLLFRDNESRTGIFAKQSFSIIVIALLCKSNLSNFFRFVNKFFCITFWFY